MDETGCRGRQFCCPVSCTRQQTVRPCCSWRPSSITQTSLVCPMAAASKAKSHAWSQVSWIYLSMQCSETLVSSYICMYFSSHEAGTCLLQCLHAVLSTTENRSRLEPLSAITYNKSRLHGMGCISRTPLCDVQGTLESCIPAIHPST